MLHNTNLATEWDSAAEFHIGRTAVRIDSTGPLFGWYHCVEHAPLRDCAAVICSPLGHEYTHSHRALRHLADRLALGGMPALRFDYRGVGDSPGDDFEPDLLRHWIDDIKAAVAKARSLSGRNRVCLLGVRLGATLAALAAGEIDVDYLVLWAPCVNGRRYLREMKAIALAAGGGDAQQPLESAGFMLSADTAAQLQGIDLLNRNFTVRRQALVVGRDDLSEDGALPDKLKRDGIACEYLKLPGYEGMFAEPQFTEVPAIAIEAIAGWLGSQVPQTATCARPVAGDPPAAFTYSDGEGEVALIERSCRFGRWGQLFGVLSYRTEPANDKPVIVLLNSGSVHHVGPHRLYVSLSRALSARGYTCLRMDAEGLGDSVAHNDVVENHPYQPSAVADTESALDYLRTQLHCRRFILLGLCSGAHTAFHAGIELTRHQIDDIILINPLTYRWEEGMSLDTSLHFQDVAHYRRAVRSARSWLKLLRGQVDFLHLAGVALSQCKILVKASCAAWAEIVLNRPSTPLAVDLTRLFALQRPLSLFIASRDPGHEILMANAKRTATKAIRQGRIRLQFIQDADHTFSKYARRRELIEQLVAHIDRRGGGQRAP